MELVFGGTFDPPTLAHVALPQAAAEALGASQVRYVPAALSPHKRHTPPTSSEHRVAMLGCALQGVADTLIDLRELDREGPSWTIDTLESLALDCPGSRRLLMGSDQAMVFHTWHRWREIIDLAEPVVMLRAQDQADEVLQAVEQGQGADAVLAWRDRLLDLGRRTECSTRVREAGDLEQVPGTVAAYIREHGLYEVHA